MLEIVRSGTGSFDYNDLALLRLVRESRKKLWTKEHQALSDQWDVLSVDINNFIRDRLNTEFRNLYSSETSETARLGMISRLIFDSSSGRSKDVINSLSPESRRVFDMLRARYNTNQRAWTRLIDNTRPFNGMLYDSFIPVGSNYRDSINRSRLPSASVSNPHPSNIRVLAATTQNGGSLPGNHEQASIHTRWLSQAMMMFSSSMDEAISYMERQVHITGRELNIEPQIQTPIASSRSNPTSWRRQDNANQNVRRIAIIIAADDGSGDVNRDVELLRSNYFVGSYQRYRDDKNPQTRNQYRVDRLVVIRPPTSDEASRGITLRDKIMQAYREVEAFVNEERRRGDDLAFEGIAHWLGHGMTIDGIGPGRNEPDFYREGSQEFFFITNRARIEGLTEDEIKKLERTYLSQFRYFIQDFNSCQSGAAIE